jgi:hypothetical protein
MSRDTYLRRVYGISEAEYDAMWTQQGGKCWICKEPPPESQNLCVDHNHRSGETRGLTCQRCNRVLGMVGDDPEILFRMLEYLRIFDGVNLFNRTLPNFPETQDALPLETIATGGSYPQRTKLDTFPIPEGCEGAESLFAKRSRYSA